MEVIEKLIDQLVVIDFKPYRISHYSITGSILAPYETDRIVLYLTDVEKELDKT